MKPETKLAMELLKKALNDVGAQIAPGVYCATPPTIGTALDRFHQLCKENGIDPETFQPISDNQKG